MITRDDITVMNEGATGYKTTLFTAKLIEDSSIAVCNDSLEEPDALEQVRSDLKTKMMRRIYGELVDELQNIKQIIDHYLDRKYISPEDEKACNSLSDIIERIK